MALGAACVLLLAGAFPLLGAPEVYRSGAVLLLGALSVLLCFWGGWRLAAGARGQLVCGLVFLFFTVAGLNMLFLYGAKALEYAAIGGAMWAGFVGMGCVALTGVVFMAVFGFLCCRVMNKRILWLAGAHWAVALLGIGAFVDAGGLRAFAGERLSVGLRLFALPSGAGRWRGDGVISCGRRRWTKLKKIRKTP